VYTYLAHAIVKRIAGSTAAPTQPRQLVVFGWKGFLDRHTTIRANVGFWKAHQSILLLLQREVSSTKVLGRSPTHMATSTRQVGGVTIVECRFALLLCETREKKRYRLATSCNIYPPKEIPNQEMKYGATHVLGSAGGLAFSFIGHEGTGVKETFEDHDEKRVGAR
jgi:hypothetical protein